MIRIYSYIGVGHKYFSHYSINRNILPFQKEGEQMEYTVHPSKVSLVPSFHASEGFDTIREIAEIKKKFL